MFRNGKCLSYKKNWGDRVIARNDVHNLFLGKIDTVIADDVRILTKQNTNIHNSEICYLGDVRKNIDKVPDNSLDLIITSPPYLNSRDYTDIYMLELKVLQLVSSHEELQALRKSTIRSHVQVKYFDIKPIDNLRLKQCLADMKNSDTKSWNSDILNMICGYFEDMQCLQHLQRRCALVVLFILMSLIQLILESRFLLIISFVILQRIVDLQYVR